MNRHVGIVIVILLAVIGALTVLSAVIRAFRWLLILVVVVVLASAVWSAVRGGKNSGKE